MSNAFLYRMPSGIPGDVSRPSQSTIEPVPYGATAFAGFGLFAKVVSGKIVPLTTGDTAAAAYGLLVRPYPTQGGNASDPLGTSTPPTTGIADVMRRGYMTVKNNAGTASLNSQVYVRVANASSGKPIGGIEAVAEATFTGGTITGTGTGTIAGTATGAAVAGTYSLTLQTTSNTSKVTVIDPNGLRLADATVGTEYTSNGVTFTITAAGTMTAGDSFAPVVAQNALAITGAKFMHAADANGNVEIAFNI